MEILWSRFEMFANWLATLSSLPLQFVNWKLLARQQAAGSGWRTSPVLQTTPPPPPSPLTYHCQPGVSTNILRKFLTNFFERLVIRTVDILDTWVLLARHQVQRLSDKNVTFFVWRAIISGPGQERSDSNSFPLLDKPTSSSLKY